MKRPLTPQDHELLAVHLSELRVHLAAILGLLSGRVGASLVDRALKADHAHSMLRIGLEDELERLQRGLGGIYTAKPEPTAAEPWSQHA